MTISINNISFPSKIGQIVSSQGSIVDKVNNLLSFGAKALISETTENALIKRLDNFITNKPHILFTCDYIVEEKKIGCLIVFEHYSNASHYEIFKRNKFDNNPGFERILFLTAEALQEEAKKFMPYLKDVLGFDLNENSIFIILDDLVKIDRIYEYKIKATFVPQDAREVDYEIILRNKDQIKTIDSGDHTIGSISSVLLGSESLSWVIPLLNPNILFFGSNSLTSKISNIQKSIIVPKDVKNIIKIFQESMFLFGAKKSVIHLLTFLGGLDEITNKQRKVSGLLNKEIFQAFSNSINESQGTFSIDSLKDSLQKSNLVSFSPPEGSGTVSFNSLENLSKILNYTKLIDISMTYAENIREESTKQQQQDTENLMKAQEMLKESKKSW